MDPLARSLVKRVGDHADDLQLELGIRPGAPADMFPDRARALEEMLREAPVDDHDLRVLLDVHPVEIAPLDDRDRHRLEIAGRQRIHERLHVFAVGGPVSLDGHRTVPFAAAQDRHVGKRRRGDARR